jgi:hypothetical protein
MCGLVVAGDQPTYPLPEPAAGGRKQAHCVFNMKALLTICYDTYTDLTHSASNKKNKQGALV